MSKRHNYKASIEWTGNSGKGTQTYGSYQRSYNIILEGKNTIKGSSDPAFLGDKTQHNPEEMLLAAISSCHMLWYLHLCANEGIVVTKYRDNATALMLELPDGSGKFSEAVLNPVVTIANSSKIDLAKALHLKANKMCFIANSINFTVKHFPVINIENNV